MHFHEQYVTPHGSQEQLVLSCNCTYDASMYLLITVASCGSVALMLLVPTQVHWHSKLHNRVSAAMA